jgi:alkylhydroperoxidase/carboxymuconolactone decarboxylase family protein YurZ
MQSWNETREAMMKLREASIAPGKLSAAHKAVISAALFAALRCEPCIKAYLAMAYMLEAEMDDVLEVFNLVTNAQGCVGDVWSARAVEMYKDLVDGTVKPSDILDEMCDVLNPERMVQLMEALQK